ncbi:c-type cytochrome [Thermoleptolyngbya sp.]
MRLFFIAVLSLLLVFGVLVPVRAANLETGAAVFEVHCAGCHVNGGNIIRRGKTLKQPALEKYGYATVEAIAQIVANGKANMSAYKDQLTVEEIESVAAYVLDRAATGWKS